MKLTKSIVAVISILAVSVSVLAQQPPQPPGGPGGPPPGGPGGPPPGGPGDDMPTREEIIAAVGPACAQYVPNEPPSDEAAFLSSIPDSCKTVFEALMQE